jgi:hypothetical protein
MLADKSIIVMFGLHTLYSSNDDGQEIGSNTKVCKVLSIPPHCLSDLYYTVTQWQENPTVTGWADPLPQRYVYQISWTFNTASGLRNTIYKQHLFHEIPLKVNALLNVDGPEHPCIQDIDFCTILNTQLKCPERES